MSQNKPGPIERLARLGAIDGLRVLVKGEGYHMYGRQRVLREDRSAKKIFALNPDGQTCFEANYGQLDWLDKNYELAPLQPEPSHV